MFGYKVHGAQRGAQRGDQRGVQSGRCFDPQWPLQRKRNASSIQAEPGAHWKCAMLRKEGWRVDGAGDGRGLL